MEAQKGPSGQPWSTLWELLARAARKSVNFFPGSIFQTEAVFYPEISRGKFIKPKAYV